MFVAGGAVQAGGGIYLERDADRELLQHCLAGDFTYILTSRQMGKSSLMYRAAERLADGGARPVIIDLTELGAQTTADQWYKGFLLLVQEQLGLRAAAVRVVGRPFELRLCASADSLPARGRARRAIRAASCCSSTRSTRRCASISPTISSPRSAFCTRTARSIRELERISFVLIGVATPNDLIKDAARTPFNIGHRIELTDFTRRGGRGDRRLPGGVRRTSAPSSSSWIIRWTGGHPYLTMRVLRSLVESPPPAWTAEAIDARMHDLFLGTSGESDTNLQFVRDMLTKKAFNREAVLATYQAIRSGARVPDKELDQMASWLKLSGIVGRHDGLLRVRNAIYEHVFDQRWARVHRRLHVNWRRRLARAAAALLVMIVLVTIPLAIFALRQRAVADGRRDGRPKCNATRRTPARRDRKTAADYATEPANGPGGGRGAKAYDPKAAAQLSTELAAASTAAEKEMQALTDEREKLRRERDAALESVKKLNQENAGLRQSQRRAGTGGDTASESPVACPTCVPARSVMQRRNFGRSAFTPDRRWSMQMRRGGRRDQAPSRQPVVRGSAVSLTVLPDPRRGHPGFQPATQARRMTAAGRCASCSGTRPATRRSMRRRLRRCIPRPTSPACRIRVQSTLQAELRRQAARGRDRHCLRWPDRIGDGVRNIPIDAEDRERVSTDGHRGLHDAKGGTAAGPSRASSRISATKCHPEHPLWASRLWSPLPAHYCV